MKWIREPDGYYTDTLLGLTKSELRVIQSAVKKVLPDLRKRYDRYRDIYDGGEATDRQQDKMFECEEILSTLEFFLKQ